MAEITEVAQANKFIKTFEKLRYRHDAMKIYNDLLALFAISISNAVNFNKDREEQYLKIIQTYSSDEQELFPQMYCEMIRSMCNVSNGVPHYRDFLGEMFESLQLTDDRRAQFFTPKSVSDMVGVMNVNRLKEIVKKRGYVKVHEPCIGGGSMVMSVINEMFRQGLNPCKQMLVLGFDLDIRCVYMSYIQLSLAGIPAIIQHRDTLTNEIFDKPFCTPIFAVDGWATKLTHKNKLEPVENLELPAETVKSAQLSLF